MSDFPMKETLEVVLAAAVIGLLIILLFRIIGSFDEEDAMAKATLERLETAFEEADRGFSVNFYLPHVDGDLRYYLVYFGDGRIVADWKDRPQSIYSGANSEIEHFAKYDFFTSDKGGSLLCVCYGDAGPSDENHDGICNYCVDVELPVELVDVSGGEVVALVAGTDLNITKVVDKYVVEK